MKKIYLGRSGIKSKWNSDGLELQSGKTRGGCFLICGKSNFDICEGIYILNHVQMDGGCIYLLDCHNVTIYNNIFFVNKAKWGGAIYLEKCTNIIVQNNILGLNFAIRDGGAISISECHGITLQDNKYVFNYALRSGYNIDVHNSSEVITDTL